jgi:TM2 domain-containing membrane protein YozV
MAKETKFCSNCGAEIDKDAEICPKCGVRVKIDTIEKKSAGIAAVLSFIIPGAGQVYNGQLGKGILFFIVGIILALTILIFIGVILYPLFWIYNIYDAYNIANKINAGKITV